MGSKQINESKRTSHNDIELIMTRSAFYPPRREEIQGLWPKVEFVFPNWDRTHLSKTGTRLKLNHPVRGHRKTLNQLRSAESEIKISILEYQARNFRDSSSREISLFTDLQRKLTTNSVSCWITTKRESWSRVKCPEAELAMVGWRWSI